MTCVEFNVTGGTLDKKECKGPISNKGSAPDGWWQTIYVLETLLTRGEVSRGEQTIVGCPLRDDHGLCKKQNPLLVGCMYPYGTAILQELAVALESGKLELRGF